MNILITNDDGFHAPGLYALAREFSQEHDVTVLAPFSEQSGKSRSITYRQAMLLEPSKLGDLPIPAYRLEGTPADCVRVAIGYLLDETPDLILSGIDDGFNTHFDAPYSGTVAASLEGLVYDVPGMAISCETGADDALYTYAARRAEQLLKEIGSDFLARSLVLNMNVPRRVMAGSGKIKRCARTNHVLDSFICVHKEGDAHHVQVGDRSMVSVEDSDQALLKQGHITLGPLSAGCGEDALLDLVAGWLPEEISSKKKEPDEYSSDSVM